MLDQPLEHRLRPLLDDPSIAWSIGRHGAIAEFSRTSAEAAEIGARRVSTARGGLELHPKPGARLLAWEAPGTRRGEWIQRIALCAPADQAQISPEAVAASGPVRELGPDENALRPRERAAPLFDLGVGGPHVLVGVRTGVPALLAQLREGCGRPLLKNTPLMHDLVLQSPHRVFLSRLGRLEVYQPIAVEGGHAPEGPHTHLLPALLAEPDRRPEGLPAGWIECVVGYPASPLRDALGRRRAFDPAAHGRFQSLLAEFGEPRHLGVKRAVTDAVLSRASPLDFPVHEDQRAAVVVTLRQLAHTHGETEVLARWRAAFDMNPVD